MHNPLDQSYEKGDGEREEWEVMASEPVLSFGFEHLAVRSATNHPALEIEQIFDGSTILILLSSKFEIHRCAELA